MAINTDNARQTEQAEKLLLNPDYLLRIYEEQFRHVRHLETADMLSFAILGLLSLGIFVLMHRPLASEPHDALGLAVIAVLMLGGLGIHGTTRRMAYRLRHIAVINRAGVAMGAVRLGVIPASFGGDLPATLWGFWKKLILGYRGPAIVVYTVLIWATVFSSVHEMRLGAAPSFAAGVAGVAIAAVANFTSAWSSWSQMKQEMLTLKQEMELGSSTVKNLAEQHCDLADSLVRLRPPRLNEALAHYQQAAQLEPQNPRARAGLEKLMSWRVQDYR